MSEPARALPDRALPEIEPHRLVPAELKAVLRRKPHLSLIGIHAPEEATGLRGVWDSSNLSRESPDAQGISGHAKPSGAVFRFRAVPDEAVFGPLTFDVLEARAGSLRFLEPSRRTYEELAAVVVGLVIFLFLPYLIGLLPWSLFVAMLARDTLAYPRDMRTVGIGFLIVFLVVAVASVVYSPRLMAHHPRVTESVSVKQMDKSIPIGSGWREYRLLLDAAGFSFWVTVKAKSNRLQRALEFAGQTA